MVFYGVMSNHDTLNKVVKHAFKSNPDYILQKNDVETALSSHLQLLSSEQVEMVKSICFADTCVSCLKMGPGSGQSYVMKAIIDIYLLQNYRFIGASLSWSGIQALSLSTNQKVNNFLSTQALVSEMTQSDLNGDVFFQSPTLLMVSDPYQLSEQDLTTILGTTSSNAFLKMVLIGEKPGFFNSWEALYDKIQMEETTPRVGNQSKRVRL